MGKLKQIAAPGALIFVLPVVLFAVLLKVGGGVAADLLPRWCTILGAVLFLGYGFVSIKACPTSFTGPKNVDGVTPKYADNGLEYWLFTVIVVLVLNALLPQLAQGFHRNFVSFLVTMNFIGFGLCVYLYATGKKDPTDDANPLFKFYRGLKHHPRLEGVDVKQWTNCRFGMMAWQVIILLLWGRSIHTNGFNLAIAVNVLLQTAYIGKFFHWETGYFNTLDITLDRAGYYICWGCLVFVPAFYTLSTYYAVNHPPRLSKLTSLAALALGGFAIAMNYWIDYEKQVFKTRGKGQYITDGKRKLLVSGFWGKCRHINYTFEILLALAWCMVAGPRRIVPYLYVGFLTVLLLHRIKRDETKCAKKYGKLWKQYCRRVPYRLVPGLI